MNNFSRDRQYSEWALSQLAIQPYQHMLEVGYGPGFLLEEVARTLKIGFLAGIEASRTLYQKAYRRNKRFIREQLLELHIGELYELSYPAHYFHTIYGSNVHLSWHDPVNEFIRLTSLLKDRGRLVIIFNPGSRNVTRKHIRVEAAAEKIRDNFCEAGLTDIHMSYRELSAGACIAATGMKA
jgi:ubiquinone/menaquinone biosynthesis C-methylase UbiE